MKKFPIALQVYSVRDQAEDDFAGTMAKVREMGYDGVELAGTYGRSAVECKRILDGLGLALVCAHVPLERLEDDSVLEDYAATGMRYIAIPWMEAPKDEAGLEAAVERIRNVALRCRRLGMTLLYHNHDFEFNRIGGAYILDTYYARISPELLQTELDTCWVSVGGEDPADFLGKYAGRAPIVHLKDYAGGKTENMYGLIGTNSAKAESGDAFEYRPLGCGRQNVGRIVQAAEDAGTAWLIVEQDEPSMGKTSLECAKISIDYLKTIL